MEALSRTISKNAFCCKDKLSISIRIIYIEDQIFTPFINYRCTKTSFWYIRVMLFNSISVIFDILNMFH